MQTYIYIYIYLYIWLYWLTYIDIHILMSIYYINTFVGIWNRLWMSLQQRYHHFHIIGPVQWRLRGHLIEEFKYLNRFTAANARGLFDYDLNDRARNNGAKLTVKHFNTLVAQHFYPIKITTTWNALPNEVVSSRTVNSFKNSWDKHFAENPPNVRVYWLQSSTQCAIQMCTNKQWKWTQRFLPLLLLLMSIIARH